MKIPHQPQKRLEFYREIVDVCLASRSKRLEQYSKWRSYYFFGTAGDEVPSAWNLVYSHLDLVTSFLYASDSTRFSVRMGSHADRSDRTRTGAFAKRVMESWKQSNADVIYQMGILWALVYDTTLIKHIRRNGELYPFMVDPACFGVYREDVPMLDRQEAFVHTYYITKSALSKQLALHPRRDEILKTATDSYTKIDTSSNTPPFIEGVILTSGQPGLGMSSLIGEANINLSAPPDYRAQLDVPVIEMQETYVWNDAIDDYQTVTMASGNVVVYDRRNIFMPRTREFEGEHGFVQICPNPLPDYFWGQSELSKLTFIQDKLNARMADIERLEAKQVDPPNAWGGMGLPEDKLAAFNSPGADIAFGDANFKRETFIPTVPEHIYNALDRYQQQMNTVSGLENTVQGKGESGVRSAGHAGKLLTVGSARPKKRGMIIEDSLEKGATLYGRAIYIDDTDELYDDNGIPFIPAQMNPNFYVEIDAHSNSPIFTEDQRAMADKLLASHSINRERYIQMYHPPMEEELLRDLREKIIPGEEKAAQEKMLAEAAKQGGNGNK